jgi:hypothetical protein
MSAAAQLLLLGEGTWWHFAVGAALALSLAAAFFLLRLRKRAAAAAAARRARKVQRRPADARLATSNPLLRARRLRRG